MYIVRTLTLTTPIASVYSIYSGVNGSEGDIYRDTKLYFHPLNADLLYLFFTFNCFLKVSSVGGEKEWYFFCLRGRKYRNSIRPNRVTGSGFWKATGIDRPICSLTKSGECIGLKKSLVYYRGSAGKGTKTDWMMHEFRLPPADSKNGDNTNPSLQEAVRFLVP